MDGSLTRKLLTCVRVRVRVRVGVRVRVRVGVRVRVRFRVSTRKLLTCARPSEVWLGCAAVELIERTSAPPRRKQPCRCTPLRSDDLLRVRVRVRVRVWG